MSAQKKYYAITTNDTSQCNSLCCCTKCTLKPVKIICNTGPTGAVGSTGTFTLNGPTGAVLYYNGIGVTGSANLLYDSSSGNLKITNGVLNID